MRHRRRFSDAAYERETVILVCDADAVAAIYTAQPTMIRRLQKNPLATRTEVHRDDRGRITGVEFELPKRAISIRTTLRRRTVSVRSLEALARRSRSRETGQPGHAGDRHTRMPTLLATSTAVLSRGSDDEPSL